MLKRETRKEIAHLMDRYPALKLLAGNITESVEVMSGACRGGGKILVCGNGGSASDSLHIVGELMKGFMLPREIDPGVRDRLSESYPEDAAFYMSNLQGAIPAIALTSEISLITAFGNDQAPELAFAQQVLGYGRSGDVLIAISTSGNSANVVHAARVARVLDIKVISLTGADGGRLRELSDVLINVPSGVVYQIQELHLPVYHAICLALEQELF